MRDEKQRFSLRKLSVGLVSVLIGITFTQVGQTVHADTINDEKSTSQVETPNDSNHAPNTVETNETVPSETKTNNNDAQKAVQNDTRVDTTKNTNQNVPQVNSVSAKESAQESQFATNMQTVKVSKLSKNVIPESALRDSKVVSNWDNPASQGFTKTNVGWTKSWKNNSNIADKGYVDLSIKGGTYDNTTKTLNHDITTSSMFETAAKVSASINPKLLTNGNQILLSSIAILNKDNRPLLHYYEDPNTSSTPDRSVVYDNQHQKIGFLEAQHSTNEIDYVLHVTDDLTKKYAQNVDVEYDYTNYDTVYDNLAGSYQRYIGTTDDNPCYSDLIYTDKNNNDNVFHIITKLGPNPGTDDVSTLSNNFSLTVQPNFDSQWSQFDFWGTPGFNATDTHFNKVIKLTSLPNPETGQVNDFSSDISYGGINVRQNDRVYLDDHTKFRYTAWNTYNFIQGVQLANNLTANQIQEQLQDHTIVYSKQSDNSYLIGYNFHTMYKPDGQCSVGSDGSFYTDKIDDHYFHVDPKTLDTEIKDDVYKSYAILFYPDKINDIANASINFYKNRNYQPISEGIFFDIPKLQDPTVATQMEVTDVTPNASDSDKFKPYTITQNVNGQSVKNVNWLNIPVNYLDDDNNENLVSSDVAVSYPGQDYTYKVKVPNGYILSDPMQTSIHYGTVKETDNAPITIHLKHKHETIVGDSSDTIDLYRTHTRTIHYNYEDGSKAKNDDVQSVIFTRSADKDLATGKLSNFTTWTANGDYSQINVPIIHGYTASQNTVPEESANVDHDSVITVVYSRNKQNIHISFVDDTTGRTLDTVNMSGYTNDDSHYTTKPTIDEYVKRGYVLASDDTPQDGTIKFDSDDFSDNQNYTVHLRHNTQDSNLERNITRTIHYVYANGQPAQSDSTLTITFKGKQTTDLVTKQITKTVWDADSKNFTEVSSPLIPGYTADQTLIGDIAVTPTSDNIVKTVTYNPNEQNIHVVFIDDTTGNTLNTVEKSGYTGTDSGYSTKDDIDALIAKGYKLVSDDTPKESPTLHFDSDDFTDDQNFTVHMKHDTKTNNLTRDVTRTIHYVYVGGKPAEQDKTDSITFNGVETIDKVNGNVLSTVWTPESKEFASVNTPSLAGYTPDKFSVDSSTIKPDSDNIAVTVTYNPDAQYAKFNYIDDTTGNQLKQETSHGVTGGRDSYSTANLISYYKNKGYDLVSDDTQGKTLTFDNDDNADQVYAIHFAHGTVTIDPQNPGKPGEKLNPQDPSSPVYPDGSDNLTRKVDREIDYIYSDGSTAKPSVKDSLIFNNTEKIDKVTGQIISSTWDGPKNFADISSPIIEGYTPDKSSVENKGIKHDNSPIKVVIKYSADPQHMKVIYRDLTTSQILSQFTKDGVSDEDGHYNTKSAIDGYVANGYVLSRDDTNGKDLIFDHNDKLDQVYYVDFTHGTHQYNPEKPNTKDQVNKSDYLADYSTVISYVDSSNKKLNQDKMVADEYKRDLTIDSVTGKILSCGEWQLNKAYTAVNNPVIQGYITRDKQYKPVDAQKNQKFNVIYAQLGKLHLVDNKGKQIAPDVVYSNDAQDPTKASVTKVPSVNGYEQITFSVDPTKDPTISQNVVFNAPAQVIINYVDTNTGKTIHTDTVKGFATHTSDYSTKNEISDLVGQGYVLTKNNVPTSIKLTEDPQNYTINLVHGISKVSHNNPVKGGSLITGTKQTMPNGVDTGDLNRIITRTITVIDPHTGKKTTKQVANLFRDATVDNVTKTITYTDWNVATWDEFTTPIVAGYTPRATLVEKENVTPDTKDSAITITYTANTQTGKISYVDTEGHEVDHTPLSGKTDDDVKVTPVIPHGWVMVDGQTIPNTIKATAIGIPTVSIKIKHGTIEVTPDKPKTPSDKMPDGDNYPDGVTSSDLNRDITRMINVVDPHTGLHTTIQTAHLSRNAVVDLVTKAITYGKWNTATWDEFTTPAVAGYTPSIKSVAKTPVDISTKNTVIDITYTANPQTGKISYVDKDGKEISKTDLTGKTDEEVKVTPSLPHGWVLDGKQDIPTSVKAGPDGIPTVTIKIKHGQLIVTPDKPHKNTDKMPDGDNYLKGVDTGDLNKDVTRTIVLHMPNGDKQVNQVAKYTRVATIDLVTGKVTYSDWDTKTGWSKFEAPSVNGYKPSQKEIVAVAKPKKDTKIVINYTALPSDDGWNGVPIASTTPSEPQKSTPTASNQNGNSQKPDSNKQTPAKKNKKVNKKRRQNKKRNNSVKLNGASAVISAKSVKNGENRNNNRAVSAINNNNRGTGQIAENDNLSSNANSNSSVNTILKQNSASQLPQTGNKGGATEALAGMLLASMGIATAVGANRKKKYK